jgi:hypothetical protein
MSAVAPAPSDQQHLRALARANQIRLARAALKRQIAGGRTPAAEVILEAPWEAASMTVADVLTSQRRWGTTRCRKVLSAVQISETKTVGALTERQRRALARRLEAGAAPEPVYA